VLVSEKSHRRLLRLARRHEWTAQPIPPALFVGLSDCGRPVAPCRRFALFWAGIASSWLPGSLTLAGDLSSRVGVDDRRFLGCRACCPLGWFMVELREGWAGGGIVAFSGLFSH